MKRSLQQTFLIHLTLAIFSSTVTGFIFQQATTDLDFAYLRLDTPSDTFQSHTDPRAYTSDAGVDHDSYPHCVTDSDLPGDQAAGPPLFSSENSLALTHVIGRTTLQDFQQSYDVNQDASHLSTLPPNENISNTSKRWLNPLGNSLWNEKRFLHILASSRAAENTASPSPPPSSAQSAATDYGSLPEPSDGKISTQSSENNSPTKLIYDATLTQPRPEWNGHKIPRMKVVYPWELGINPKKHSETLPSDAFLRYAAGNLPPADIYCIDIEHLEVCVDDEEESKRNTKQLVRVVEAFRAMRPDSRIGFWGIFPRGNYVAGRSDGRQRKQAIENNARGHELADKIDIIFPSLYRVRTNKDENPSDAEWVSRAKFLIDEARKYNKPVYGFIRPLREVNDTQNWPLQLRFVYDHADAIVIWSHTFQWTPEDLWWKQTIDFLDQITNIQTASYD